MTHDITTWHEYFRNHFAGRPGGYWDKGEILPGSFGISLSAGATPGRVEASDKAEQDAQLTFGTPYEVLAVSEGKNFWGAPHWVRCRIAQKWLGVAHDVEVWIEGHRHQSIPKELFELLTSRRELSAPVNVLTHVSHESDAAHDAPVAVNLGARLPLFHEGRCLGPGGIFRVCSLELAPVAETGILPRTAETFEKLVRSRSILGASYLWGGDGAQLDCSGFTKGVMLSFGVEMPRNSSQQETLGEKIERIEDSKTGDLVFYGLPAGNITHVGFTLRNGSAIKAVHARQRVRIDAVKPNGLPESVEDNRVVKSIRRVVSFE
jgi:hypothetical protein